MYNEAQCTLILKKKNLFNSIQFQICSTVLLYPLTCLQKLVVTMVTSSKWVTHVARVKSDVSKQVMPLNPLLYWAIPNKNSQEIVPPALADQGSSQIERPCKPSQSTDLQSTWQHYQLHAEFKMKSLYPEFVT